MNNPKITGIIFIEDLPENLVIDLESEFKKRLFLLVKREFKEWLKASEKLNLNYKNFLNGKKLRNKPKPIYFFKKICEYLEKNGYDEFKFKKLEKYIILLKSKNGYRGIKNPKLPFNFNSHEGGCFISCVLHDGSIKSQELVNYCNKKNELRNKIINISKNLFGEVHYIQEEYTVVFPKVIAEILIHCLGMKKGRKSISDAHVPEFLLKNPNKEAISGYLDFAISDDGSVGINLKHSIYRIRINLTKDVTGLNLKKINNHIPNLLKGDKLILEKLDINVNGPYMKDKFRYRDKGGKNRLSLQWEISITNLIDIEKFYENVKLTHSDKQKRLEKIIKLAKNKNRQTRKGNVFKWSLNHCKELEAQNLSIKASILSKNLKRSLGRTQWILKRMVENNLIKKIGEMPNKEYIYKVRK